MKILSLTVEYSRTAKIGYGDSLRPSVQLTARLDEDDDETTVAGKLMDEAKALVEEKIREAEA